MPYTDQQKAAIQELKKRRNTLPPERQAAVDELSRRVDAESTTAAPTPPASRGEGLVERGVKDLKIGWQEGKADVAHTVANVANAIPIPASRRLGASVEEYAHKSAPKPEDVASHQGVVDQVIQGAGSMPGQIVKFLPTQVAGKYAPLVGGAIAAAGEMDKGVGPALKAGAEGAATFYGMGKAANIKKVLPRAAASAAIMAAPAAIESGGDVKKTAAAAITGAAFGVPSHGERMSKTKAREMLKGGMDTAVAADTEIKSLLAPATLTPESKLSAEVFKQHLAQAAVDSSRAEYALRQAKKGLAKLPLDQRMDFIVSMENKSKGATQATPQLTKFADTMRTVLDTTRDRVIEQTGRLQQYYEDYFPHIWKDPEKAADFVKNFYASKRPLQGSGGRFKERTYPTIEDGIAAGLELAHENPVDSVLATVGELNRFLMAHSVKKALKPASEANPGGYGINKFVPIDMTPPQGYSEYNDPSFRVFDKTPKSFRTADGSMVERAAGQRTQVVGRWVGPNAVTQVFNNYLSRGGLGSSTIYRTMKTFGNTLNQAQLGLSGFHAGFTSIDSAVSRFSMGIEQIVDGIRSGDAGMAGKGVKSIASSPAAPITNAIKGYNLRRALLDPQSIKDPMLRQMADMVILAGGRADVDATYKDNLRWKMQEAFRADKPMLGLLRLPGALIEMSASPLMDHFVPWQKLGVFSDLARFEMDKMSRDFPAEKYPSGLPLEQQREAMQKAWTSVDNRMGQLVYDNLFWNKTAKDLGMLSIRSVGWNLGTIREVVGGVKDWGHFFAEGLTPGKKAEFTHRMAYVTSLPIVVGTMGAITNYLFTGEAPQSWKDYLAPRTGRKDEYGRDERIWYPSYLKDIYHYSKDPLGTLASKVHPMFSMVSQMLHNEDFYGVEIANHKDPLVQQLMDYAGYTAEQFSPLSVKTAATRESGPETPMLQKAAAFIGVVPAPATIKKSAAENMASEILARQLPKGTRTREEDDRRVAIRQIKSAMRAGMDASPLIAQAVQGGLLSIENINKANKTISFSPLFADVKAMKVEDAIDVLKKATPEERKMLRPLIYKKLADKLRQPNKMSGDERANFNKLIQTPELRP